MVAIIINKQYRKCNSNDETKKNPCFKHNKVSHIECKMCYKHTTLHSEFTVGLYYKAIKEYITVVLQM